MAAETIAGLRIVEWQPGLAAEFAAINREWIEGMFALEGADRVVLDDPGGEIIAPGGAILFVAAEGRGIVGTGALRRSSDGAVELTKMGVRETARGLKAGEALLAALIARGQAMGADPLYLLTNRKCEAAIHLYEKLGFIHEAAIMERFGGRYGRANVAMRFAHG